MKGLILISKAWSNLEYFSTPPDRMLVHCGSYQHFFFVAMYLYSWVEKDSME